MSLRTHSLPSLNQIPLSLRYYGGSPSSIGIYLTSLSHHRSQHICCSVCAFDMHVAFETLRLFKLAINTLRSSICVCVCVCVLAIHLTSLAIQLLSRAISIINISHTRTLFPCVWHNDHVYSTITNLYTAGKLYGASLTHHLHSNTHQLHCHSTLLTPIYSRYLRGHNVLATSINISNSTYCSRQCVCERAGASTSVRAKYPSNIPSSSNVVNCELKKIVNKPMVRNALENCRTINNMSLVEPKNLFVNADYLNDYADQNNTNNENELNDIKYKQKEHILKLATINVNGLTGKLDQVAAFVNTYLLDIVCIQETKLHSALSMSCINIDEYDVFRCDRNVHDGGVCIYVRSCYKAKRINCNSTKEIVGISIFNGKVAIFSVYKPPNSNPDEFYTELIDIVTSQSDQQSITIIAGDTNMNMFDASKKNKVT
jgi:hypothetical protein